MWPIYPPAAATDADTAARIRDCRSAVCYQDIGATFGAKKLIAGGISRDAGRYTVTLTLYDLTTFTQQGRAERSFVGTRSLDIELAALLEELFHPATKVASAAPISDAPISDTPLITPPMTVETTATPVYRYRGAAITLTTIGVIGLLGGGAMLATTFILKPGFESQVAAYNASADRSSATFTSLTSQKQTLDILYTGSFIAMGVGAASLITGIILFAVDGKKEPQIVFAPMGAGAMASIKF